MKRQFFWNSFHLTLYVPALAGIFVLLYVLLLPFDRRFDLTGEEKFTLSGTTREVVQRMSEPVRIHVFYHVDQRNQADRLSELLESYQALNREVSFQLIELDREPLKAARWGVENYGEMVIEKDKRLERTWNWTEESITNALLRLENPARAEIYFTEGHGELSLNSDERRGLGRLNRRLIEENRVPSPILLSESRQIPKTASAVFIVSPKVDFYEEEIEQLEDYLRQGGSLAIFLDPVTESKTLLLESFLAKYGIQAGEDVVIDEKSKAYSADSVVTPVYRFTEHPMTKDIRGDVLLPLTRSIRPASAQVNLTDLTVVAVSSPMSWAETDLGKLEEGTAVYGEEDGTIGLVPLAVLAEGRSDTALEGGREAYRILVVGDSDFISNSLIRFGGHQAFISGALSWLVRKDAPLTIKPNFVKAGPLYLTPSNQILLFLVIVVMIPLCVALSGFIIHFRRFHPASLPAN
ncbi:MAG: GldG family protein [Candidatus Omnitrophica bacterium]|nr:GldG family protein [Candidatus Omnitrophota bacterium]